MAPSNGKHVTELLKAAMSAKTGAFPGWRSSSKSDRELACPKSTDPGKSAVQGVHVTETQLIENDSNRGLQAIYFSQNLWAVLPGSNPACILGDFVASFGQLEAYSPNVAGKEQNMCRIPA